jgi:hypothetical protein
MRLRLLKIGSREHFASLAILCVCARNLFCLVNNQASQVGSRKDAKVRKERKDDDAAI